MTDDPLTPRDEDDFLAAEYALGLAEGEDLTAARDRLRRDRDFAERVALWQERLVVMTDGIAPVTPGRKAKKELIKRLFPKQRVPLLERLWVWKGFTLAALIALAYFAMPTLRPPLPEAPLQLYATPLRGDVDDLELLAVVDPAKGDVALRRISGGAPSGRVLELWAILPDQAPISLGVLPTEENARVMLPQALRDSVPLLTLAISDEPPGGAPEGSPTGAIRAVGALSAL
ncbi:MAG: hypothetical protein HKN30_01875 [Sulfitobacter sp.]|nr:hypothetical protein [Sulfitobacter sp.]